MAKLVPEKTYMIDYACDRLGVCSFADLGGIWGVEGGYTFYALQKHSIEKAFLVDTDISDTVREKQISFPQLTLINSNFGSYDVADQIGKVDAIFLFDVLLHQVSPDWDEIISIYSKNTNHFIIYNQQFTGPKTVRLLDLGEDEYFRNVPHNRDMEPYKSVFEKMYQIHPKHNRIYRDIHNIWQWGITDKDLVDVMNQQGFEQIYYKNSGQWGKLINFEGHAFIFAKQSVARF